MDHQVAIITGAAGFLGSAITVDLSRDHQVVALDRRKPSGALMASAPGVVWRQVDIADVDALAAVFRVAAESLGRIDFVVHFAAFYHFGIDWRREYDHTNIQGTSNVLQIAAENHVRRVIFASSIAAMRPSPPGTSLTETTPTADYIPYAQSKSIGEQMVQRSSGRLPGISLRIAGAFSDWSELPPLSSLIRLWSGWSPLGRVMVGRGETGIPHIHRHDVVRIVRRCIERHHALGPYEVFLASQHGTVLHGDLFPLIRQVRCRDAAPQPILVAPAIVKLALYAKCAFGYLTRSMPYERPWMLQYADRPWVTDTTYTQNTLGWDCTLGMGVLDRLPAMLERYRHDRTAWEHRNRIREAGQYAYDSDDLVGDVNLSSPPD